MSGLKGNYGCHANLITLSSPLSSCLNLLKLARLGLAELCTDLCLQLKESSGRSDLTTALFCVQLPRGTSSGISEVADPPSRVGGRNMVALGSLVRHAAQSNYEGHKFQRIQLMLTVQPAAC